MLGSNDAPLSIRAARALARYVAKDDAEKALEELRDLCVEIEEEGVDEMQKGLVRVLAGTAFVRECEVEEALETLGAGSSNENLDAYVSDNIIKTIPCSRSHIILQGGTHSPNLPLYQPCGPGKERVRPCSKMGRR